MDNAIVEVVLGLVLIYVTLALLAMKVQETLAGDLLKRRVGNLHNLIHEAVGQDTVLQKKLFENPLVFALSEGSTAKQGLVRSTGPSAIPPEIFARALLMELNGGRHPSEQYGTPSEFITARSADKNPSPALASVGALLAGREASWPGFEAAIAQWFNDIGDRSKGWYQRESQRWALFVALALAAILNVDTFYIAEVLSSNPELRRGLADLAERVNGQFPQEGRAPAIATPAGAAAPSLSPSAQVSARLADAILRLNDAFQRDNEIVLYRFDQGAVWEHCDFALDTPESLQRKRLMLKEKEQRKEPAKKGGKDQKKEAAEKTYYLSNSDIWLKVLPNLKAYIDTAQLEAPRQELAFGGAANPAGAGKAQGETANRYTVIICGAQDAKDKKDAQGKCEAQGDKGTGTKDGEKAEGGQKTGTSARPPLHDAYRCLSQISAWVGASASVSKDPSVRNVVQEAAVALEASKLALKALIDERQRPNVSLRRLYQADPEAFNECASGSDVTRSGFQDCMARALAQQVRLPIGFTGSNARQQFCTTDLPAEENAAGWLWLYSACSVRAFEGNAALGIPRLRLYPRPAGTLWLWLIGVIVSAFFIALGAPFWFDVLGKFVNLRAAGRPKDDAESAARGRGIAPAAAPPSGAGPGDAGTQPRAPAPFSPARNRFEDQLVASDIVRLQQRLGVTATGQLDTPTRNAIADYCKKESLDPTEEMSFTLFDRIVGRSPVNVPVTRPDSRLVLRQQHARAPSIAKNLMAQLKFPSRIASTETRFSDDLRALAVLYRYKKEKAAKPGVGAQSLDIFRLAKENRAVLNELDASLEEDIVSYTGPNPRFERETPPWVDWAIGELGQLEENKSNRNDSNPRVCEYLDTAVPNAGNGGDTTAWCGAFAAWVLKKHIATLEPGTGTPLEPPADSLAAASWVHWGATSVGKGAAAVAPAKPGDIVVVAPSNGGGSRHVGFVMAADAAAGAVWVLGGNQAKGTCVCLSRFTSAEVVEIRRAAGPPESNAGNAAVG
jgi:uncharacterized protein (TIGR02594 family)